MIEPSCTHYLSIPLDVLAGFRYPRRMVILLYLHLRGDAAELRDMRFDLRMNPQAISSLLSAMRTKECSVTSHSGETGTAADTRCHRYQLTDSGKRLAQDVMDQITASNDIVTKWEDSI